MMRTLLLSLIFMLCGLTLVAQDKIHHTNGTVTEAKVLEINPSDIRYKKHSNLDGPTYTILKKEVQYIVFANGTIENIQIVSDGNESSDMKSQPIIGDYRRRLLSVQVLDLQLLNDENLVPSFGFGYEWQTKNYKFAFRPSFNVQYSITSYYGGLDFKYFPTGANGATKYFCGISNRFGIVHYDKIFVTSIDTYYSVFQFMNGVSFNASENFNVSLAGSLGPGFWQYNDIFLAANLGVFLGFRL